jgi:UDP-N-acetylmuramoylalanine--D-glutamate ligase
VHEEFSVKGLSVAVVGAARSGIAAAELLVRRGARVTLTDLKSQVSGEDRLRTAGVHLELGAHSTEVVDRADLLVTSPGVPPELAVLERARQRGIPVIGELELASRWLRGRIVAITGTKGKSTTTTLVGRMLAAAGRHVLVGGNIGVPLSAQVDDSTPATLHVIEVSSFQLETTDTFHAWIAALLNFSPDHLDRHPDERAYAAAKARIFANQVPDDWAVLNQDNAASLELGKTARARVLRYSVRSSPEASVFVEDDFIWQRTSEGPTPLVPVSAVELSGGHMLSNVVAASAISLVAGADRDAIANALKGFTGLEHVMEPVGRLGHVRFVNDSKATNVDAAGRSIESFDRVVAIIGGRYKGGDFGELIAPLKTHGRGVVAIGEARRRVREALESAIPVVDAETLGDAVERAWELARPDGVVLLAPGCSSFDMFADYADRGRAFKEEVGKLIDRVERQ